MITALALRRFFSTPKGLLIIVLLLLVAAATPWEGSAVAPGLLVAVITAGSIDALIVRWKHKAWEVPDGAVLTGLFVAMILSPHQSWHSTMWASAIAVISKYVVRSRSANVFNPAALALVAVFYISGAGQSWWGALPELPIAIALAALCGTGIFIADRVNKMPAVLTFLGVYFLLFTLRAFAGGPVRVSEVFRTPDLQMVLFFAFFILTDPPTSPSRYRHQLVFAAIVACASYVFFEFVGSVYFLLAGVLVGNAWEAQRRRRMKLM